MSIELEQAAPAYRIYRREGMDHGAVGAYERLAQRFPGEELPSLELIEEHLRPSQPVAKAYCAFCRSYFEIDYNPPYSVIHVNATENEPARHLHPLLRDELPPAPEA